MDILYYFSALPYVGEAAGATGAALALAQDTTNNADGSPQLATFQSTAEDLGAQLANQYAAARDQIAHIGDLLMSDWGKLQLGAQDALGPWAWQDPTTTDIAADALVGSAGAWAYETLFPTVYSLYRFADQHVQYAGEYQCAGVQPPAPIYPFASAPEGGNTVYTSAGPQTDVWAFGAADQLFLSSNPNIRNRGTPGMVSQSLWNDMFLNSASPLSTAPPFPSQLAFMLDVYGTPPDAVTRDQYGECMVNGQIPG